ncbi:hypothetical protein ACHAW5_003346 [Stephanodiscus triporus]|uniref:U3 small nucleolar RNA-associated protein 15 C-terminal domain-containing protein n=1 Tax=Stephanodiscus triporus TaxID=2934178 RepID=A0ABD3MY84_9STRA
MASFVSSTNLRHHPPTSTRTVLSTTSALLAVEKKSDNDDHGGGGGGGGIESHPRLGKWYLREYGFGPNRDVRLATRRSSSSSDDNRYGRVKFHPGPGGASAGVVCDLGFSSGGGGAGSERQQQRQQLAVACGPRVCLYGGNDDGSSPLVRALQGGRRRRTTKARDEEEEDDDDDDDDGGSVDLFGGNGKKSGNDDGCVVIEPDRNVPTGGRMACCVSHRSDSRLIAIGTEGGGIRVCDARSRVTLRTFGGGDGSAIRGVAWLRDGRGIVSGGDDGLVRVWDIGGGMGRVPSSSSGGGDAVMTLRGHGDRVTCVKIASFRRNDRSRLGIGGGGGIGGGDSATATATRKVDGRGGRRTARGDIVDDVDDALGNDPSDSRPWCQLVISGSYDHTIRAWDVESSNERGRDRCVSVMDHGDPVQALLVLPPVDDRVGGRGGRSRDDATPTGRLDDIPLLASAGGSVVKVWNPFNGSCLGTFPTRHAKTITAMCLLDVPRDAAADDDDKDNDNDDDGSNRLRKRHIITAGLDGLIRIHSASNEDILSGTLPYLHGMQISDPISALAVSSDARRIAIGTTTGVVTVHQRRRPPTPSSSSVGRHEEGGTTPSRKEPRRGTYSYFARGAHEKSHDPDDYLLTHQKKQRLAEYDVLLRKFQYGDALDAVLAKRQPQAVIAVIEELGKRRGLTIALSNRDEESLDAILSFTTRFVDDPQYTPHLIGVAHILCDIYGSLRGQSAVVDELFAKLREKVTNECSVQRMLLRLLGQIDYVMTTAEILAAEEQEHHRR